MEVQRARRYSIVGLGKLGASMAAAIAGRGFEVVGHDVVPGIVAKLNAGEAPVLETDLEQTIAANRARLRATMDYRDAVLRSDVTFVIVPTPSDAGGGFSIEYAANAFREIGRALADKDGYHLVVLTSTVLPGATRYGLLPLLEEASGKRCGPDFGLCYSPEFIALGTVIRDFLNPDFTLIGESDERAGALLEACYAEILENGAPCRRMSFENAELAKIALNAYVTTKITFANMLAELCELLPGGDVDVVTGALGLDSRIGRKYLTGGAAYGGPCFPRDNLALESFARSLGRAALLPQATDRMNRAYVERLAKRLKGELRAGATVAVLGLAYKPLSHVIEESQGIHLARALDCLGMRVVAYDPLAGDGARVALGGEISVLDDVGACLDQADAVAITTPDAAFRALRAADFPRREPPIVVLDCWRLLRPELAGSDRVRYLSVGVGPDEPELAARLDAVTRNATHP